MSLPEPYRSIHRDAFASMALLEITQPGTARQMAIDLDGEHTPITRERVVEVLGHDGAAKWDAVKVAVQAFWEATP